MELDLALLNDRIENTKQEAGFYSDALRMLIEEYKVQELVDHAELWLMFGELEIDEILTLLALGEYPDQEMILNYDTDNIDLMLAELLVLIGKNQGLNMINEMEETLDVDLDEYKQYLEFCEDNERHAIHSLGFSTLVLTIGRPPSITLLNRLFPLSEDQKVNKESIELITELQMNLILKHISNYDTQEKATIND